MDGSDTITGSGQEDVEAPPPPPLPEVSLTVCLAMCVLCNIVVKMLITLIKKHTQQSLL